MIAIIRLHLPRARRGGHERQALQRMGVRHPGSRNHSTGVWLVAVGLLFFEAVFAGWDGVPIKPSVLANREPKIEVFTTKAFAQFEVRVAYVEHAILTLPSGYRAGVDPTAGQRVKEYKRLVAVDEAYGPPDKPPSKYRTDIFHLTEMPEEGLYKLKVKGQVRR